MNITSRQRDTWANANQQQN